MWPFPRGLPSRAVTGNGGTKGVRRICKALARDKAMKLPAAPESIRDLRVHHWSLQESTVEKNTPVGEVLGVKVDPVTVLPVLDKMGTFPASSGHADLKFPALLQ